MGVDYTAWTAYGVKVEPAEEPEDGDDTGLMYDLADKAGLDYQSAGSCYSGEIEHFLIAKESCRSVRWGSSAKVPPEFVPPDPEEFRALIPDKVKVLDGPAYFVGLWVS